MGSPSVHIQPKANEDLLQIFEYVLRESGSATIAGALLDEIQAKCNTYAHHPLSGDPRYDLGENARCFPVRDYVVIYTPASTGITVVQVIHGARDVPTHARLPRRRP